MDVLAPSPSYSASGLNPAYALRYSWTGWPSGGKFQGLPSESILNNIKSSWQEDGLRLLEWNWSHQKIQLTFSATPHKSPVFVATRAKGRLQHGLRVIGAPQKFSRKFAVRSIGDNTSAQVEQYIKNQVKSEQFVNPSFAQQLEDLVIVNPIVALSRPTPSGRGMYWYNLHLVLVTRDRARTYELRFIRQIRDGVVKIAAKKGYGISTLAVMPDHLHVALRGDHHQSPMEIALTFQNNLAYLVGARCGLRTFMSVRFLSIPWEAYGGWGIS